jgi:tol-pal system protein YbgF
MRLVASISAVLLLTTLTGCATRSDMQNLRGDMDEVKTRILGMEKDISGVKNLTHEEMKRSLAAFQKELDSVRKGTADLQATLDSARVDMQALTGKIDDVAIQAKKPAEDIALLKEDTNRRLTAFEERLLKVEKGFEEILKNVGDLKTTATESTPEALYQKALDTFRAGDTQKARELFTKFLGRYPKHELAANAHYWIGETYYGEKNYDQAILEFQEVIKNFPDKEKAPAAMLKQALAFRTLGDTKSARYVLKKLIEEHPLADEAKTAKEKLKEFK